MAVPMLREHARGCSRPPPISARALRHTATSVPHRSAHAGSVTGRVRVKVGLVCPEARIHHEMIVWPDSPGRGQDVDVAGTRPPSRGDLVHHVLLVDQVARTLEEIEQRRYVRRPIIEQLVGALWRREGDHPLRPVDARVDLLLGHHLAKLLLHVGDGQRQQLREPPHRHARVVRGDGLDVVLGDARVHRLEHMRLLLLGQLGDGGKLLGESVSHVCKVEELLCDEEREELLVHRQLLKHFLGREHVHLLRLLVVVGREHKIQHLQLEAAMRGGRVVRKRRRAPHLPVRAVNVEPIVRVHVIAHNERVVARLKVIDLHILEDLCLDLLGHDLGSHVVVRVKAEAHLLQDELCLLSAVHTPQSLHLRVLHHLPRLRDVALGFVHCCKNLGQPRALHLHIHLAL
mmetsp:Transcript_15884/g.36338  ORF Transcript_15884/g.36338 Transcript_15884/m.36338 type:complete len:402 (+) Transcript_15884:172-1377(+)